jgi:hypothetical protein
MSYSSRLVQGFCVLNETKNACWHVVAMVEDATSESSQVLDIGYAMACMEDPEFAKCQITLSPTEPEGCEIQKDDLVIQSWDLYQKDPKDFWKKMPKKVQDFRAKMMREFK